MTIYQTRQPVSSADANRGRLPFGYRANYLAPFRVEILDESKGDDIAARLPHLMSMGDSSSSLQIEGNDGVPFDVEHEEQSKGLDNFPRLSHLMSMGDSSSSSLRVDRCDGGVRVLLEPPCQASGKKSIVKNGGMSGIRRSFRVRFDAFVTIIPIPRCLIARPRSALLEQHVELDGIKGNELNRALL